MLRQAIGLDHVAHHQEADRVHAQITGGFDVLFGNVRLRAMGGDADGADAEGVGAFEIVHGAYAGQQQSSYAGAFDDAGDGFDPVPVRMRAKTVIEAGAGEAVAVGDLYGVDARFIERTGDFLYVVQAVLVTYGVHAVA